MHPKLVRYLVRFGLAWTVLARTRGRFAILRDARRFSRRIPSTTMPRAWSSPRMGSLLAAWYAGSGERKADDVVIEGAWLGTGRTRTGGRSF